MNKRIVQFFSALLFFFFLLPEVHAQLQQVIVDVQKDKPEKFKNDQLRSEKTGEKKFTLPRRFIQNTTSHYNYFFDANNKINSVIELARMSAKDDYSKLIPYYSYSLDNTAAQKNQLDSVIYKATAGILLHDLRSNWVDNFYLLIGEAYYFRQEFDSASMTFQFINYHLFPTGKKNEEQPVIGTNENRANNSLTISSKEDRSLTDKILSRPPSRNDALVWQVRTLTDMGNYAEAAGLINTLKNDPLFPDRLRPYFQEVIGYWFFQQKMYDSAIGYIRNALPNAIDMADKARREYLLAQLYEMNNNQDTASDYYNKAIRNTTDPLMDIYANLNKAKMLKSKDPAEIDKSIAQLVRMSKKDKFLPYRDIVFYSAAQLAMAKPDTASAINFYKASTFYNQENLSLKNRAFLNLAEINYQQKKYQESYNFYDSIQTAADTALLNVAEIESRKKALAQIVTHLNVIQREDSLQAIAAMTADARADFLKKLSKKLHKERGIKEEENYNGSAADFFNRNNQTSDIFSGNNKKGDWYFYNNALKGQGFNEFKRVWGKRQNTDNWRLNSGTNSTAAGSNADQARAAYGDPMASQEEAATPQTPSTPYQQDISVEGLMANVPLTKPAMDTSNSKIARSLFQLGKNYQNLLEDYYAAIDAYQQSLKRFPDSLYNGELYMDLSFCYQKTGNRQMADYYKNLLLKNFGNTYYAQNLLHPEIFNSAEKDTAAAHRYDRIYNLFIEGNFDEAVKEKNAADSLYGQSYWNPQLLYIQSVYYIQKRQDSAAMNVLRQIINQYPTSPMKEKATTMLDVLSRRDSIENYLTRLNVTRAKEDSQIVVFDQSKKVNVNPTIKNEAPAIKNETIQPGKVEIAPGKKLPAPVKNAQFSFNPTDSQNVLMVLTKVDPVYVSEARNAFNRFNSQSAATNQIQIVKDTLDSERSFLVFSEFIDADEAMKYLDKLKQQSPVQVSWLPAQKYRFYIISESNLELLKQNKNLQGYIDLLNKKYPGKF
ncbi:MAG TPA: tetratricopeptide repeat protein [Hanamia sp.]|nr:tetratricopeptide repeat protein [Hanamia sp.]